MASEAGVIWPGEISTDKIQECHQGSLPARPVHQTKIMIKKLMEEGSIGMYSDFHAHSRKLNIFMYGCENRRHSDRYLKERSRSSPWCYTRTQQISSVSRAPSSPSRDPRRAQGELCSGTWASSTALPWRLPTAAPTSGPGPSLTSPPGTISHWAGISVRLSMTSMTLTLLWTTSGAPSCRDSSRSPMPTTRWTSPCQTTPASRPAEPATVRRAWRKLTAQRDLSASTSPSHRPATLWQPVWPWIFLSGGSVRGVHSSVLWEGSQWDPGLCQQDPLQYPHQQDKLSLLLGERSCSVRSEGQGLSVEDCWWGQAKREVRTPSIICSEILAISQVFIIYLFIWHCNAFLLFRRTRFPDKIAFSRPGHFGGPCYLCPLRTTLLNKRKFEWEPAIKDLSWQQGKTCHPQGQPLSLIFFLKEINKINLQEMLISIFLLYTLVIY